MGEMSFSWVNYPFKILKTSCPSNVEGILSERGRDAGQEHARDPHSVYSALEYTCVNFPRASSLILISKI